MPRLVGNTACRDAVAVHRLEFPLPVNYLCYASWGACFAVDNAGQLLDRTVLAAIGANLLLTVAALALNTAADVRTDEHHREKNHLVKAARRFGRGRVSRWAVTEMTVAVLLACLVSMWSGRPLIMVAAAMIVALQVSYNVEPVRLKRHGLSGVAAFCAAGIVLPFLLSHWAVRPDVDGPSWLIVMGLGILAIGRMTLWAVPDRPADAATGMRTPSVRYGPAGALALSGVFTLAGLIVTSWGLWWRYGPGVALPLVAVQATFLWGTIELLRHPNDLPRVSSARVRRRAMPATIGTVAMAVVPLAAA